MAVCIVGHHCVCGHLVHRERTFLSIGIDVGWVLSLGLSPWAFFRIGGGFELAVGAFLLPVPFAAGLGGAYGAMLYGGTIAFPGILVMLLGVACAAIPNPWERLASEDTKRETGPEFDG